MSGSPRELAQQDRWRIAGRWLSERRTALGLSPQDLVDRVGMSVTLRRLHILENGVGEPSDAELDLLVAELGEQRASLDSHVQDELLTLLLGGSSAPQGLPTIVIVPPTEPQGPPADRLLSLVRLYQESTVADGEITLTGTAVESLAERYGISGLECWQLLARFIPGERP